MSTVVFAILVLVSSLYRPVVENLGFPGPSDSEHLESPTAHVLLLGTEADAREVVEDPHYRQGRYCQHHPQDAKEAPAYYHGQQDRDRGYAGSWMKTSLWLGE
jgi:hypothetical protein